MEQTLSTNKIQWYRTRTFWGIVIGIQLVWGLVFYFLDLHNSSRDIGQTTILLLSSLGGGIFIFIGTKIIGNIGGIIGSVIYILFVSLLLSKTFRKPSVKILFPILFSLNYILGSSLFLISMLRF